MAAILGSSELGQELCRALGENPAEVRGIVLRSYPNEAITVTIEKFVQSDNVELVKVLKKYVWSERPESETK